jgi:hypothetical protein
MEAIQMGKAKFGNFITEGLPDWYVPTLFESGVTKVLDVIGKEITDYIVQGHLKNFYEEGTPVPSVEEGVLGAPSFTFEHKEERDVGLAIGVPFFDFGFNDMVNKANKLVVSFAGAVEEKVMLEPLRRFFDDNVPLPPSDVIAEASERDVLIIVGRVKATNVTITAFDKSDRAFKLDAKVAQEYVKAGFSTKVEESREDEFSLYITNDEQFPIAFSYRYIWYSHPVDGVRKFKLSWKPYDPRY